MSQGFHPEQMPASSQSPHPAHSKSGQAPPPCWPWQGRQPRAPGPLRWVGAGEGPSPAELSPPYLIPELSPPPPHPSSDTSPHSPPVMGGAALKKKAGAGLQGGPCPKWGVTVVFVFKYPRVVKRGGGGEENFQSKLPFQIKEQYRFL